MRAVLVLGVLALLVGFGVLSRAPRIPPAPEAAATISPPAASARATAPIVAVADPSIETATSATEAALQIIAARAGQLDDDVGGAASQREPGPSRIDRMVAAGFSRARAEEILRRESQSRLDAFYAEYAATGTVRPLNDSTQLAGAERLRADLGDAEYERYLQAMGQPTRVTVGDVEPESAAAFSGLLPGDEILTYGGHRVFNLRELGVLTIQRPSGEPVAATVVRDGQPLTLYLLGGPLGFLQAAPPP